MRLRRSWPGGCGQRCGRRTAKTLLSWPAPGWPWRRGEEERAYRAFLQPVRERREDWYQEMPTPLGTVRRDQWLYLGPPELSLEETNGLCVEWNGLRFVVRAAQPVCVGEETLYWWALLAVEDGEAQTEQT